MWAGGPITGQLHGIVCGLRKMASIRPDRRPVGAKYHWRGRDEYCRVGSRVNPNVYLKNESHMNVNDASIKILKMNQVYRVTDLVFRGGIRWQRDREIILSDPEYRDTILYSYLTQKKHEDDLETFKRVVRVHQSKYERPLTDSLIIHLRLGDVMDDHNARCHYEKSKKLYKDIVLESLPNVRHATIVTALHFGANPLNNKYFYTDRAKERSFEILELLSNELELKGLDVSYKSTENIDEDICFMAGSKYFLQSLSGLSNLVTGCLDDGSMVWSPKGGKAFKTSKYYTFRERTKGALKRMIKNRAHYDNC